MVIVFHSPASAIGVRYQVRVVVVILCDSTTIDGTSLFLFVVCIDFSNSGTWRKKTFRYCVR